VATRPSLSLTATPTRFEPRSRPRARTGRLAGVGGGPCLFEGVG